MDIKKRRTLIIAAAFLVIAVTIFAILSGCDTTDKKQDNNGNIQGESHPDGQGENTLPNNDTANSGEAKKGSILDQFPRKKDVKVKGVYLTGWVAGSSDRLDKLIGLIKNTELNTVVLDIKDDDGVVGYETNVEAVKAVGAFKKKYDVEAVIRKLKENDVYIIGRLVCFRDPALALKRPDLAVKRPDGSLWRENGKIPWTNAYNEETWRYNIDIAKEAIEKGFDEIQFDYVRFPTPIRKADIKYDSTLPKTDAINGFLKLAATELTDKLDVKVSADVFGIICESPADTEDIGQNLEAIGMDIAYISPMVYPSHYANAAQNGVGQHVNGILFKAPDLEPYNVVYNSLIKAKDRISQIEGYKAKVRPYLQDFTASWLYKGYFQKYGAEQVKAQIKATYDAGYEEWILWNPDNIYSSGALIAEG